MSHSSSLPLPALPTRMDDDPNSARALAHRHLAQLRERLAQTAPFSGPDLSVVAVGSWGIERPNFQILVLVDGEAAQSFGLTQRHQWLTTVLDLTRHLGMGLSWQDIRFIHPQEWLARPQSTSFQSTIWERPIPDWLLLLVDAVPLTNAQLVIRARETVLEHHRVVQTIAFENMPYLGLMHAIQECWHRLCLHSAVHPEMERQQFGWRLALHSMVIHMVHRQPNDLRGMLSACEAFPLERLAQVLRLPVFESSGAEEQAMLLEDFQTLMGLRTMKVTGSPVAMSRLTQRRYNRFFYRLLTHPQVDESLRFTLLS